MTATESTTRPLYEIAREIYSDMQIQYPKGAPSWWGYAKPYVDAMSDLSWIEDDYLYDTADSVVRYGLANLQYWKGETARRIKAELKAMYS